jgi:hypothetical protein
MSHRLRKGEIHHTREILQSSKTASHREQAVLKETAYKKHLSTRGRILRQNPDKNLKNFPTCYSQSPLLRILPPSPLAHFRRNGLKVVCHVYIVYESIKSKNSQDYGQKPQRNCTFMNSASGLNYKQECPMLYIASYTPVFCPILYSFFRLCRFDARKCSVH